MANGQVEVHVRDAHGRRSKVRLQARDGDVINLTPPGEAFRLDPTELREYREALRIVGEVAQTQRRGT